MIKAIGVKHPSNRPSRSVGAMRPLARIIAAVLAMGAAHARAGNPVLSQAWLAQQAAQRGAQSAGAPPSAMPGNLAAQTPGQLLQQQVLQQSIANLNRAAQAVAAQISAQQAAQKAAQQLSSPVPDGLTQGGLTVAAGAANNPTLWQNANAPTQSSSSGHVTVEVKQTAQKAILTWDSFNVGRNTTLYFNQSGGNQTNGKNNNWIALNRITDPSGNPSQIFGQIKAEGTVYLLNRNGIIFGAGSQVNTQSLIASSLDLFSSDVATSNSQFLNGGIAAGPGTNAPFLVNGLFSDGKNHDVVVQNGASITGGTQGFVLLAAPNVSNAGSVVDDQGQVILAAAVQVNNLSSSSALPLSVADAFDDAPGVDPSYPGGTATNTGVLQSRRGEVEMDGYNVNQNGVALASTSISYPGSIVLNAQDQRNSGGYLRSGTLTLGPNSVTAVLPEEDGATTTSTDAATAAFTRSSLTLSGNVIDFQPGSLLEAPNAVLTINARNDSPDGYADPLAGRVYVDNGAVIDVSGLADVELPISALLVTVPLVGQNELSNSPLLRNSFLYHAQDVTVDSSQSGVSANGLAWVGSPVLNVAGYVEDIPRSLDQLMTNAGTINVTGNQVIVRSGASVKLDGGYIAYQSGWITTPNLMASNGAIYNIADADPNQAYIGFAGQYEVVDNRWGVSTNFSNPLLAGATRYDSGFAEGGNAGTLNISTNYALALDGQISAQAFSGRNQVVQGSQPSGGTLDVSALNGLDTTGKNVGLNILVQQSVAPIEQTDPGFQLDTPWSSLLGDDDPSGTDPFDLARWLPVSADLVQQGGFSNVGLSSTVDVASNSAGGAPLLTGGEILQQAGSVLSVRPGGSVQFTANAINIQGEISAPAGAITLTGSGEGNFYDQTSLDGAMVPGDITIGSGAVLSTRGLWVNDAGVSADNYIGDHYINGGSISLIQDQSIFSGFQNTGDQTGSILLQTGSLLDASSGGYVNGNGQLQLTDGVPDGSGGNISLIDYADQGSNKFDGVNRTLPASFDQSTLVLDGSLRAYGFSGGGTLSLQAVDVQIGGSASDLALSNGLYLAPSFFAGQGFDNYAISSFTDANIAPGAMVQISRDNLLPNVSALLTAPTGTDLYGKAFSTDSGYVSVGQLAPYLRYVSRDANGPGFSMSAGLYLNYPTVGGTRVPQVYPGISGALTVGTGAVISADAGAAITLTAAGSNIVDGTIDAPGGTIAITATGGYNPNVTQVWLGPDAVLNASGVSLIDPLAAPVPGDNLGIAASTHFLPRTGLVLDGGSVSLAAPQGYVVTQQGSLINVSGSSDTYDLPVANRTPGGNVTGYTPTAVWSDAGSILMAGAALYADGGLLAQPGGPEGEGGSLQIVGTTAGQSTVFPMPVATAIVLQQSGLLLPGSGLQQGDTSLGTDAGVLHFALDRLNDSGISSLMLGPDASVATVINNNHSYAPVPIGFAGDVDLSLSKSFVAYAPTFTALPAGSMDLSGVVSPAYNTGNGTVRISAPYVELTGSVGVTAAQNSSVAGDGNLAIHADFIDLGGQINLQGWANSSFTASNAVRFYVPADLAYVNADPYPGFLFSTGNISLQAAELYPVTNYSFAIDANPSGLTDAQGKPLDTTLTILGNGPASAPLSAGGSLLLDADNIVQDGTVWVPSGNLIIGVQDPTATQTNFGLLTNGQTLVATRNVTLGAGSFSSVSLDGETVPYGNTTDGLEWDYAGAPGIAVSPLTAPPAKSISINGNNVSLNDGATIDIRGGGSLQASEWVPGTGGTVNVLSQYQISYANSTSGVEVPQYTDARAIYAIVPGYNAPIGAQDAAMTNAPGAGAGPAVGQSVYLSGIAGLPAGYYTLLPAGYATLPGAFRVVQNTSSQNAVLGQNVVMPDGTLSVTGYFANALDGSHESTNTTFLVQSAPVWQQYSQYTFTTDNAYFAAQASKAGTVAPQVSADGGHLVLNADQQLQLGATLDNAPASSGRAGLVDIAAQAIQVVGADSTALPDYLQISADQLSKLGAGSLLLGGTRQLTGNGYQVTSTADSVVLSNSSADPLQGSEILLVANGNGDAGAQGIVLQPGSYLAATGAATPNATPLLFGSNADTSAGTAAISGDGALLRVSQDGPVAVTRYDTSAGSPSSLAIDAGATVQGGSSLTIDNSGNTTVDPAAVFTAKNIQATANQISFVGSGAPAVTGGLVIGPDTLSLFDDASQVTLSSRGNIDFLGNVDINLPQALDLNANAFVSDGGTVNIAADTLGLGNTVGAGGAAAAAGSGQLTLNAKQLDFTAGNSVMQGFANVTANAGQGIAGQGRGSMDFGAADVSFNTPIMLAENGAATTLTTTGHFAVNSAAGTALADDNMGGGLALSGGTLSVGTRIDALAGRLDLTATGGDLSLGNGANLDVAGVNKTFYDVTTYAAGGDLALDANQGSVLVDSGAVVNFAGAAQGGTAGVLSIAAGDMVALNGSFKGGAVTGYKGGYFSLSSGGALDLDQLAQLTHDAGTTGGISITSGSGNLLLSAGNHLTAQDVYLTANGGSGAVNPNTGVVDIEGTVNVSGDAAGQIQLYGHNGVIVNGSLLATSSVPGQFGGIIDIGTLGTPDSGANNLNSTYGYENVQAANAGSIVFGPHAIVNVAGGSAGVGGIVNLRAPLLSNGDVPITFANSGTIQGANKVSIVPYAVWSTDDTEYQGTSKYFDGLIDPAGWYANTSAGGTPQMVAGTWYDASANALPTPTDAAMLKTYLSNDYFVPDAANAAHQDFYGYVGGDPSQPGTLMGFVEQPGYTFGNRYAGIANLQVSPGVELINPDAGINGGDISVLTNWNLGAGVTAADGTIQLAYRYGANPAVSASGTAPTISLLALHNVNVDASITDGFYQQNNGATIAAPVLASSGSSGAPDPLYDTDYNLYLQAIDFLQNGNSEVLSGYPGVGGAPYYLWNGGYAYFYDPTDSFLNVSANSFVDSTNSQFYQPVVAPLTGQGTAYYQNYGAYINDVGAGQFGTWSYTFNNADYNGFLYYNAPTIDAPQIAAYANYSAYAQAYQTWLTDNFQSSTPPPEMQTPSPLLSPLQSEANSDYAQYSTDYASYIAGFDTYYNYVASNLTNGVSTVLFYAPFTPYSAAQQVPAAANNSPSNMPSLGNPVSLASATLLGGSSSSYQLVAGANFASANPLATVSNKAAGNVNLDGDFAAQYAANGGNNATLEFPTVVRTGTGSIDVVAAGDIDWLDKNAPAAIYTAGAPAAGTTAGTGVTPVVPSGDGVVPDWLVNDMVHPDNAGDILLQAGGDIHGIEQVYDTTGDVTGTAGTFIGQFWWPWMETGNSATGSSINFSNFDQGVMSVGGNVAVNAGGDISDLSVSLPTTWYANAAGTAITTVGGGNLSVTAGGDILSGSYFVARGTGSLSAGGLIGSDFSYVLPPGSTGPLGVSISGVVTPVSTLLALQDAQWSVQARDGVDIADILNPSYASPESLTADAQSYSASSAVKATTASGDLTLGSLAWETQVLGVSTADTDLGVLPSTLDFTALNGNIHVLTAGGLYPSATGNLSLLAGDSIQFSQQNYDIEGTNFGNPQAFGLIDADASLLPSPLQPQGADVADYGYLSARSYLDQGTDNSFSVYLHQAGLHAADTNPVRVYALNGSIVNGTTAPNGIQMDQVLIEPDKPALIYAGQDIVDLSFLGQQTHASDITRIVAGGSIYDSQYIGTNLLLPVSPVGLNYQLVPVIEMSGVGTLDVEAGRNMGPFTSQTDLLNAQSTQENVPTGIQSVGNAYNPYLPHDGASINVLFGVGPGIETGNFLSQYLSNPAGTDGFGSLLPDLVTFMEQHEDGYAVNTGFAKDQLDVALTTSQAEAAFQQLPSYVQQQFVQQEFFKLLAQVDTDYNDPGSPYYHQYARGYAAIQSLFPASLGYTNNGAGAGGLNGEAQEMPTGDLDIRSSTIQTQQGGDINILGPGGQALIGSIDAPPVITNASGHVLAGPNDIGVLTLEQGNVNIFTDRSLLLAQSRVFTEQGGNMVIWSSNGDINAGQGAKTVAVIPPPTYLCDLDAFCLIDARGEVSGAGIATLQTIPDAPSGNVYLVAPRGTVDAGDAGIRVSGNVVLAAAQVLNAVNIQAQGDKIGVPVVQAVNISALSAASAAAGAVTKVAQDMMNQQKNDALSKMPSIISVQMLGFGSNDSSSIMGNGNGYDPSSPVQVLGAGHLSEMSKQSLTKGERQRLVE